MQARTSHSTDNQKKQNTLKTWMSYHSTLKLLHGCVDDRNTLHTCIYKNIYNFLIKWLHVCLPIFASILHFFGNSLHAAVFKSPKIQCEYLHSRCSPFVRNQFEGKKKVLTDTSALKSIDPDAYLVPSFGFIHSSKNMSVPILTQQIRPEWKWRLSINTHRIFMTNQYTFSKTICFLLFVLHNFLKPPPFRLKSSSARERNTIKVSFFFVKMIVLKNNFFQFFLFAKIFCPFIPCTQSQSDWGENKITQ